MSYTPFLVIGLSMLVAVAGSSRFVQLVSIKDRMETPLPRPRSRHLRLAHAALLLLVVFWPGSPSQAPVRETPSAVEAGDDATQRPPRPCLYVKRTQTPPTTVS